MRRGIGFSQAGIGESQRKRNPIAIRPMNNIDVIGEDGMDSDENESERSSGNGKGEKGQHPLNHWEWEECAEWDGRERERV